MDKTKDFEFAVSEDKEAGVGEHKWYGRDDRTEETSIHDKGKGEAIVIRLFEFKFPPTLDKLPTKEQLLTPEYVNHLHKLLWADALRMAMEPRVHITKEGCKIFVPCVPTTGNSLLETPKLLQEWL